MQYDNAYSQCMYSRGNQVPGYAPPVPVGYAPVGYGAGRAWCRAVQIELNRLGYMRGPADGVAGPQTVSAIQNFEASHGLPVDGAPSDRSCCDRSCAATPAGLLEGPVRLPPRHAVAVGQRLGHIRPPHLRRAGRDRRSCAPPAARG